MSIQVLSRGGAPKIPHTDKISATQGGGVLAPGSPARPNQLTAELTSMLSSESSLARDLWERPLMSPELEQSPGPYHFWDFLRRGGCGLGTAPEG